jgi:adenylate cyclase
MKRYFLICIVFVYSLAEVNGQPLQGQARLDSLIAELPKQKTDTNKAKLLMEIATGYSYIDGDEGIKYSKQLLSLSDKLGKKGADEAAANAHGIMGDCYTFLLPDYKAAIEHYTKAITLSEKAGDYESVALYTGNIATAYDYMYNHTRALEYYLKAQQLNKLHGFQQQMAAVTANIGTVYQAIGDYDKALEYFLEALEMDERLGYERNAATVNMNISNIYLDKFKDYPKALSYADKALKYYEKTGNGDGISRVLTLRGHVHIGQNSYYEALDNYIKSRERAIQDKDLRAEAVAAFNMATVYLAIVDRINSGNGNIPMPRENGHKVDIPRNKASLLNEALLNTNHTLAIALEIENTRFRYNCYENLRKIYTLKGDYKKAMAYTDSFHMFKDSIFTQDNREEIVRLSLQGEFDMQRLADSLQTAEQQKISAMKLQRQKNYTYLGIAGILVLAGFSFFIVRERRKSEKLLLNILPKEIANELKNRGATTAEHYDKVTVLFTDFVDFTKAGERMGSQALVEELHNCFKAFDGIMGRYGIEKIKTIGDAYLAVCGLPKADEQHAEKVVRAAKDIQDFMLQRHEQLGDKTFEVRIGVHSGEVVAGIVGVKKFAYDIWGDTVNTAARMESNSEPGKINISETTYDLVKDKFNCTYRGEIEAKGKGMLKMYFVEG